MNYKIKVNKGHQLIALSNTILREIASHITQLITNYDFFSQKCLLIDFTAENAREI